MRSDLDAAGDRRQPHLFAKIPGEIVEQSP